MRRIVAVLLCWLVIAGCAMQSAEPGPSPKIIERWSGNHGGSEEASTLVLRGVEEWRALWRQVGREMPREFDATREIAVAIFIGQRNTGGYSVEIGAIQQEGGNLRIEYREKTPQPGMMVAQVITSPWIIALVTETNRSTQVDFVRLDSRGQQ